VTILVYYEAYIYTPDNATGCPCPVLLSMIKGVACILVQNNCILQCKVVFNDPQNGCIMEISNVTEESVSATILSPRNRLGQVVTYHNKLFVQQQALAFNGI